MIAMANQSTSRKVKVPTVLPSAEQRQTREKASRFAVLGMLSLGSKSGYDIKKSIAESTSNFWSESYGNIYPVLKKLLAQEAILAENGDAQAGSRQKQLYSITKNGKKMLADWLRQPVIFRPKDDELLLKLFFGTTVSPADSRVLLKAAREYHATLLRKYEGIKQYILIQDATKEQKTYWLATLHCGEATSSAMVEWCDATDKELQKLQ
jgi:PadR family transcriptional regulator AphA